MQEPRKTLANDVEAKKYVSIRIYQFFQSLAVYGKDPESLESMVDLFNLALADYTLSEIQQAFVYYLKNLKGMPEPCDIVQIIERNGKPPFDKTVYISIQKKHPEERISSEWEYLRDYENFIITGSKK